MPRVRVLSYWRAEQRTIRQGFAALVIASLGNLIAGVSLGSITGTLEALPGLMVLVPAAIGMRGNIFGAMTSRLGTSIHAGLFEPTRRPDSVLGQNVAAATVLTFAISLALGVLAKVLSEAFGVSSISIVDFVVISLLGGVLSSLFVGAFAVGLAIGAYRRGWDLDSVAAPLITAAGDVVTIPSLFLATFLVGIRWVTPVLATVTIIAAIVLTVRGLMADLPVVRRVARESILLLTLAGTVDIFAGLVIETRLEDFVTYPALLVLIPPFLADAGALGGILTARLSSKLHLGVLTPRGRPESVAMYDGSIIILFAVFIFVLVGLTTDLVATLFGLASPGALTVVGISLLGGLIATLLAILVAYYAAIATYRLGMDPDSHGIPLITSSMDFVGVVALIIAILAFGVG